MPQARSSVFVGSSSEQASVAQCLAELLHSGADVHPWWESESFKPNSSTLESLLKAANKYDFGVFIFSSDDIVKSRKKAFFSVRDNVLFEFGLFLGVMGADRTFALVADSLDQPIKTPTDLLGINLDRYTFQSTDNLRSSIGVVCSKFERQIKKTGPRQRKIVESWEFSCETQAFGVTLAPDKMAMHGDKLNGRELLLVFRKENPEVHRDLDPHIGLSSLRLVDPDERRVVLVARKPMELEPIKKGETVQGFLFLAPAGGNPEIVKQNKVKLTKCRSMHELKDAGCQLLEGPFSISD